MQPNTLKKPGAGILLVEDDEFVREAASEILESCGYRVFKARNSAQAIGIFHQYSEQVELLVSDVVIPGKNGRELSRALRELSPELKVLYVSGYSENAMTRQTALEANSHFVAKPFSLKSLLEAVDQAFTGHPVVPRVKRASCSQ